MKKFKRFAIGLIASGFASHASASSDGGWYAGASYSYQEAAADGQEHAVGGILTGYRFSELFSVEARIGWGARGFSSAYQRIEYRGSRYAEDIRRQGSLLLKGMYPLSDAIKVYALGGISETRMDVQAWGENRSPDGSAFGRFHALNTVKSAGFTYGLGVNYLLMPCVTLSLEYQVFPDVDVTLPDNYVLPASEAGYEREKALSGMNFNVSYSF